MNELANFDRSVSLSRRLVTLALGLAPGLTESSAPFKPEMKEVEAAWRRVITRI